MEYEDDIYDLNNIWIKQIASLYNLEINILTVEYKDDIYDLNDIWIKQIASPVAWKSTWLSVKVCVHCTMDVSHV